MPIAEAVDVVSKLGLPGLLGVALGARLSYFFGRRLLDDEVARSQKARAIQVERDAADRVEVALNRLHAEIRSSPFREVPNWGLFHNRWQDEVLVPAARIREPEIGLRIRPIGNALFYAMQQPEENLMYGVLHAIENAAAGLRALLHNEPMPPSFFPTQSELHRIMWENHGGRPNVDRYRDWLAAHPSTV